LRKWFRRSVPSARHHSLFMAILPRIRVQTRTKPRSEAETVESHAAHSQLAQSVTSGRSKDMGEIIRFVPRAELERARLIREARAIYDSIFPADESAIAQREPKK
jgi:hypothetical protein